MPKQLHRCAGKAKAVLGAKAKDAAISCQVTLRHEAGRHRPPIPGSSPPTFDNGRRQGSQLVAPLPHHLTDKKKRFGRSNLDPAADPDMSSEKQLLSDCWP